MSMLFLSNSQVVKADDDGSLVQIGEEYVQYYSGSPLQAAGDRMSSASGSNASGNIIYANSNWGLKYRWGNSDVWEKDFKSSSLGGNDYRLADDVDLLIYAGHGVVPGSSYGSSDYALCMNNQNNSFYARQGDMRLGDRDLEWFVTFTCNFTRGTSNEIGRMFNGLHALCGYKTDMYLTSNAAPKFAYWAAQQKYPISVAYEKYAWDTQPAAYANEIRVFRATSTWNDHLWGFGSVAADPVPYSSNPSAYSTYEAKIY